MVAVSDVMGAEMTLMERALKLLIGNQLAAERMREYDHASDSGRTGGS